eukprot:TRINITY_DN17247_c0_g1_i1.p1 TRINITY_DN17247_c0_g1~~TRINITY_DN17247_c0_g1_i1.p1  ORF type:complete len:191 (-),score=45.44 TRINITY_DN17247_c0_g1_i1:190-762(-)
MQARAAAPSLASLATDGERRVVELVDSAHSLLGLLHHTLNDENFWISPGTVAGGPTANGTHTQVGNDDPSRSSGSHVAAVTRAHESYRGASTALRAILKQLQEQVQSSSSSAAANPVGRAGEEGAMDIDGGLDKESGEEKELRLLEQRAQNLRVEVSAKNRVVKELIDGMRELVDDVTLMRSLPLVANPS